jgi:glycosyltransferase involved in cell wall biosynthesis
LSPEKGIETLLDAWKLMGDDIPLRIVGDGPLADRVAQAANRPSIEWLGRRPSAEVYELMGRARCVIVPSGCYENFPRVVVEALAKGTPVVASDAGAAAELVIDGLTGFRFRAGDATDLACVVRRVLSADLDLAAMRQRARREYESKYTGAVNYEMLMAIYGRAIAARSAQPLPLDTVPRALAEKCGGADA